MNVNVGKILQMKSDLWDSHRNNFLAHMIFQLVNSLVELELISLIIFVE